MSTPQMPHIPGAAVMTDTLDFVKNLWGSMGVPGLAAPTLSVDELDKKINDLKAVESWLNLNTAMLRSTIQALEVQRGTLATLKSMGQSLADTMQQKPGRQDKALFDANPYAAAFFQHLDPTRNKTEHKPENKAENKTEPGPEARAASPQAKPQDSSPPKPDLASAAAAQMANPAAWWNLLQEQFKQAVSTAMTPEAKVAPAAPGNGAAAAAQQANGDGGKGGATAGQNDGEQDGAKERVKDSDKDSDKDGEPARKGPARKAAPKKD